MKESLLWLQSGLEWYNKTMSLAEILPEQVHQIAERLFLKSLVGELDTSHPLFREDVHTLRDYLNQEYNKAFKPIGNTNMPTVLRAQRMRTNLSVTHSNDEDAEKRRLLNESWCEWALRLESEYGVDADGLTNRVIFIRIGKGLTKVDFLPALIYNYKSSPPETLPSRVEIQT